MKKCIATLTLFVTALVAFGQVKLSAGAGMSFAPVSMAMKTYYSAPYDGEWRKDYISGNIMCLKAFLDARYVEIDVGYMRNLSGYKKGEAYSSGIPATDAETTDDEIDTWLSFAALLKYPLRLKGIEAYPLLGLEYNHNLSAEDEDGKDLKIAMTQEQRDVLNQLWFKIGAGADIALSSSLYIRPEVIVGFKFLSDFEKGQIETAEAVVGVDRSRIVDVKLDIGVAAGWRIPLR